ncbi:MAG: NACHT domain-containing protein [Victivallaceae bacterium]|jgi:hypothetical protein
MDKSLLYLHTPSTSKIEPPIDSTVNELPIEKLEWEDFEKLCLRIAQIEHSIDDCEIYGVKGQKQDGIDIFARKDNAKYISYQCKRYQKITESILKKAINEFKKGKWFLKCDEFKFCTTFSLNTVQLQDKFSDFKIELCKSGIDLIKWDKIQLCRILKDQPQIVYEFFGKEWVKLFNGEDKLNEIKLNSKLDANEVAKFRKELYNVYSTVFQQNDPSIPSQEFNDFSFLLQERFILPDVLEEKTMNEAFISPEEIKKINNENIRHASLDMPDNKYQRKEQSLVKEEFRFISIETRVSIDAILPKYRRTVILGDPGSGKSTLLHYIVLDLLSSEPQLMNISQEWGGLLPIWLPFAYITKNLTINENLNIAELLEMWFKSINRENLFCVVKDALDDNRLLLIIDGIDEWTSTSAAKQAISKIEIQANIAKAIIIYSSRPYGYRLLKDSFQNVHELQLAPFSEEQQKKYIFYWYEKWTAFIKYADPDYARNETNNFLEELNKANDFKLLSENPLLLSILIAQRFKDSVIPKNKITALEIITDHLISKHPIRRRTSANIIDEDNLDFELGEVFSELAIHIQKESHEGVILKTEAQKVIETYLIKLMGYEIPKAKKYSKSLLDIGANNIGIIVEKSNDEIAFMHRQFQEFLAAKYLFESDRSVTIQILREYSNNQTWNQVITFLFGLIPNRKGKDFKDYLSFIDTSRSNDAISYSTFLKYELLLNLNNAPVDIAKESLKEIVNKFEYETNKNTKDILWKIILESIYNAKIKDDVCNYLFTYFPNNYKFNDYRLNSLQNISLGNITQVQRAFILKSLINGNEYQKLDASNTIKFFIKDEWLYSKIIEILDKCFNPEILPYALNCIITENIGKEIKFLYLEKFKSTEHPCIALFATKLKIHLQQHTEDELNYFIELQKMTSYTLDDEVLNIFIDGWPENDKLLEKCIASVERNNHRRDINNNIAWKILFHCFNKKSLVVDRIIDELKNEKFPFLMMEVHKNWQYLVNYFRNNEKLIPVIDEWIKQQEFKEMEIAYASLVGRTEYSRRYLLDNLPKSDFPHWPIMALIEGWKEDIGVQEVLENYFKSSNKRKCYAAHFISSVFRNNKQEGIEILENIIFNKELPFRDRAIQSLIALDKDYFETKILEKCIEEELELLPRGSFNEYYNAQYCIVENYKDLPKVKNYVLSHLKNASEDIDILIRFYPEQIDIIDDLIKISQPLAVDYRLKLVEKIGERISIDTPIAERLTMFSQESEDVIKSTAAINYFNHLKTYNPDEITLICKNNVFYCGFDLEVQRQIAFCGYFITKHLSEYFALKEEKSQESANPHFSFELSFHEMSPAMIKLLINNFDYLISEVRSDFNQLVAYGSYDLQKIWGFWAKYSDKSSSSYSHIMDYIISNEDKINDQNLIDFLNRTSPKSKLLKNIVLRLVNDTNDSIATLAGQILGGNFNDDAKIYEVVNKLDNDSLNDGKVVALCIGWPASPNLKIILEKLKDPQYQINEFAVFHLKFLFRDVDNIMDFFDKIFENYNEAKCHHKNFISPMLTRIRQDKELQGKIKEQLLKSESITCKVSFYSILSAVNNIDKDIIAWKEKQNINQENVGYGYNIITNNLTPLSEILYDAKY